MYGLRPVGTAVGVGGHELNASGGVIAYVLSSTHAIEFFQEDMCYLSE